MSQLRLVQALIYELEIYLSFFENQLEKAGYFALLFFYVGSNILVFKYVLLFD